MFLDLAGQLRHLLPLTSESSIVELRYVAGGLVSLWREVNTHLASREARDERSWSTGAYSDCGTLALAMFQGTKVTLRPTDSSNQQDEVPLTIHAGPRDRRSTRPVTTLRSLQPTTHLLPPLALATSTVVKSMTRRGHAA